MKPEPKPAPKIVPLHRGPNFQEDASGLLVDELLESGEAITARHLAERIQALFDRADDTFFDLADKAENNAIQTLYFDAMRQLRLDRKDIEERFIKAVRERFHERGNAHLTAPSLDQLSLDDISLVEETDLEESLAIDGMAAKARQRYNQALYALEQRFCHLQPSHGHTIETLPAGPQALSEAFRKALRAHEADLKIKLILYKLFDKHVMSALDSCYEDLNTFFIRAGVLPELKMQIRKVPGQSTPATTGAPGNVPGNVPGTAEAYHQGGFTADAPPGDGADLLATLQQLLTHAQGAAPATGPVPGQAGGMPAGATGTMSGGTGFAPAAPVLSVLTNMQQQAVAPAAEGTDGGATLRAQLVTALGPGQAAALRQVDNDLIDIVSLLFDFILEDDNLPATAKALLARLQIPMLKVAMLDREFFSRKNHPARRLLNLMANACIGLDDEAGGQAEVLAEVERVVNHILEDFSDDVGLFDTLVEEFSTWQSQREEREEVLPAPVSASFRRREEIALAKQWVMATVAEHLMGRPVPDTLHALITGPWTEVLLETYLRHGEDSVLWLEQIRFVDILLWSVEPKQDPADRRKLGGVILSLVQTLRDGLEQAGCPGEDVQRIINSLESYHMASLHGRRAELAAGRGEATAFTEQSDMTDGEFDTTTSSTLQASVESAIAADSNADSDGGELDSLIASMQAQLADLDRIEALLAEEEGDIPNEVTTATGDSIGATADTNEDMTADYIEDIVLSGPADGTEPGELLIDDQYLGMARELPVGTWLTFQTDTGEAKRGRLAWKSDLLGQYTFVNWRYQVIADLSAQGLAAHLRRGSARPVDALPLFDRAMSALVSGLKRTGAEAGAS